MRYNSFLYLCVVTCATVGVFAVGGDYDYSSKVAPSQKPPSGLANKNVPQFIVLGSDDNAKADGVKWLLDYIEGKKNPTTIAINPQTYDNEQISVSFYTNTMYFSEDADIKTQLKRAHTLGCEVANHTVNHVYCLEPDADDPAKSKRLSLPVVKKEADDCNKTLIDTVGIPAKDIKGFRTPYLAYTDTSFTAMKELGFTYDCSIEEGVEWGVSNMKPGNYYWPYTLDYAAPGNDAQYCWWNETYGAPVRTHEGLWELPCYMFSAPPDDKCEAYGIAKGFIKSLDDLVGYETDGQITGLDHNMWADTTEGGFRISKAQSLAVLKYTLDQNYANNRAPMTVGMHSQFYVSNDGVVFPNIQNIQDRKDVMQAFLDYALDKTKFPDVRIVSGAKAIKWCMNPVALNNTGIDVENTCNYNSLSAAIGRITSEVIQIYVPKAGEYTIYLYSLNGKLIKAINLSNVAKGSYSVGWNGTDLVNQAYVVSLEGMSTNSVKKVCLK